MREHIPEGNIIIFEGPQRVGKTMAMVAWCLDAFQNGRNVFSNIELGFEHRALEFSEIELETGSSRFWNGHIGIDELNFYFDCRKSMSGDNLRFSNFLLQQKKQGCNLTGTTHDLMSLDLRIRDAFDFLIKPKVYPAYPEKPVVLKMDIENGPVQAEMRRTIRIDCRPIMKLYDSFAVYDPFQKKRQSKPTKRGSRANLGDV